MVKLSNNQISILDLKNTYKTKDKKPLSPNECAILIGLAQDTIEGNNKGWLRMKHILSFKRDNDLPLFASPKNTFHTYVTKLEKKGLIEKNQRTITYKHGRKMRSTKFNEFKITPGFMTFQLIFQGIEGCDVDLQISAMKGNNLKKLSEDSIETYFKYFATTPYFKKNIEKYQINFGINTEKRLFNLNSKIKEDLLCGYTLLIYPLLHFEAILKRYFNINPQKLRNDKIKELSSKIKNIGGNKV